MKAKKKLIVSMLVVAFVLLSIIATVAIAFALTQQTIKTSLNIGYTVEDIDGTASATFTIGGVTENLTAMKGENVIGDKLVFKAGDTENAGNLMFPEDALALTAQNDNVVIQYTYSNTGAKHYIASMDFDANIEADNMKVEYSIDGVTYSEDRYAVVVPANTSNKSYWIKISIEDKAKSASFTGDFNWLLNGCDPQDKEYLSMPDLEFQGSDGAYSASIAKTGEYYSGDLVFPSSVNGEAVTTIAASSLTAEQKVQVTSVYIPDSVTTIGESAFEEFTNLETVTLEQNETISGASVASSSTGLTTIGSAAFSGCSSLDNVVIPTTVSSIGQEAFLNCVGLTTISTMKNVGNSAFKGCTNLKSVTVTGSIGNYAFEQCTSLTSANVSNASSIGISSFSGCESLTTLEGDINIKATVGAQAFANCPLTSVSILASEYNMMAMDETSFNGCANLKNVTLHTKNSLVLTAIKKLANTNGEINLTIDTITSIDASAFSSWTGLKSVTLGNGVTTIGMSAFSGCTGLASIVIPNSVTKIEDHAFMSCNKLTSVIFENVNGWQASDLTGMADGQTYSISSTDLSDPATAATLLKTTYLWYALIRG